jgi:predicted kinase
MMTGLPGSGKSTFAKTLEAVRFNLDDMRAMQGFGIENRHLWTKHNEAAVKEALVRGVVATVDAGLDVVVDNTHLTPKFPRDIRDRMHGKAVFKVHSFLDVPIETCIERDSKRDKSVGEEVIRGLFKGHQGAIKGGWRLTDEWMNVWPDVQPAQMNPRNPFAIICDLDGTLALHVNRGPYETSKLETDALNMSVFETLFLYWMHGTKIILLSGRDEGECREATVRWLKAHKVNYDHLFMRPEGDKRPDYVIKYELFKKHIEPHYWVSFFMEDRDQCVALWRQFEISAHQVNYGNF